jgi:hypothetical protein
VAEAAVIVAALSIAVTAMAIWLRLNSTLIFVFAPFKLDGDRYSIGVRSLESTCDCSMKNR